MLCRWFEAAELPWDVWDRRISILPCLPHDLCSGAGTSWHIMVGRLYNYGNYGGYIYNYGSIGQFVLMHLQSLEIISMYNESNVLRISTPSFGYCTMFRFFSNVLVQLVDVGCVRSWRHTSSIQCCKQPCWSGCHRICSIQNLYGEIRRVVQDEDQEWLRSVGLGLQAVRFADSKVA